MLVSTHIKKKYALAWYGQIDPPLYVDGTSFSSTRVLWLKQKTCERVCKSDWEFLQSATSSIGTNLLFSRHLAIAF